MARRSHDEYSNSSEERTSDITAQFWGSSPSWRTTGKLGRTRRGGDRSGPVARTRSHGDRTGRIPVAPAVMDDEPRIDPYDFGFDDVGYEAGAGVGGRSDASDRESPGVEPVDHQRPVEPVELIELDERRDDGGRTDTLSMLVERLGLGAVDPLLLRLGVIVLIGVLLVPLAMTMRPDASNHSVRTETTAAPSTQLVTPGDAPLVEQIAPLAGAGSSAGEAPALDSSDQPVAVPTTTPVAIAQKQPQSASSVGDMTESADESGSDSDSDEAVQAPGATVEVVTEAAEADEPADRIAPVCDLTYTVVAGDYWIRVADLTGTTLAKLLQANLATISTPLFPGDEICLPEGATLPMPSTTTTDAPTTTTAPTTVPPTTTEPIVTTPPMALGEVDAIIREVWPDDLEERALEIAWRESGFRPNAHNWCCYGLFQIYWNVHKSWLDDLGITSASHLLDARTNARAAYALYQRSGGWGPWD